jgi:hypothetical protein
MEYMTREEAIAKVGIDAVDFVDSINCEITGRVLDNPDIVEFSATIGLVDSAFEDLTAYYHQYQQDMDEVDDLGSLDWEIYGYEVS